MTLLVSCTAERVPHGDIGAAESLLTPAERRDRAGIIRDVARERGLEQGWLLAGVADAETAMSHCWSELTWACMGPTHPDCGGGPVVAGAGDGPCDIQQGGLGMFQFDGGTYAETLARDGEAVLSLRGNIDHAVDFVIDMMQRSEFVSGIDSDAEALEWMNGVRVDNERLELWARTVTRHYNGCRTTSSCWPTRLERYRSHAVDIYHEMGAEFWNAAPAYAADWVEQGFPLAAEPFVVDPGTEVPGFIDLRNTGTETWRPGATFLGTTQPRDGESALAASDWISPSRPATVDREVRTGEVGHFEFSVRAPTTAGDYPQFFSLVQEEVTWFADAGGFPDDQLQVRVTVERDGTEPMNPEPMNPTEPDPSAAIGGRLTGGCNTGGSAPPSLAPPSLALLGALTLMARRRRRA